MAGLPINSRSDFERVVALARERSQKILNAAPGWPLAEGIARQIDVIGSHLERRTAPSKDEADRIVLGVQGVRNFDDGDPDFSLWLSELDYAFRRWSDQPDLFV